MEAELLRDPDLADQPGCPVAVVGHAFLWRYGDFGSGEGSSEGSCEGSYEDFGNGGRNGCACGS